MSDLSMYGKGKKGPRRNSNLGDSIIGLRCAECQKLLAELITPPYRIVCSRCSFANEVK